MTIAVGDIQFALGLRAAVTLQAMRDEHRSNVLFENVRAASHLLGMVLLDRGLSERGAGERKCREESKFLHGYSLACVAAGRTGLQIEMMSCGVEE